MVRRSNSSLIVVAGIALASLGSSITEQQLSTLLKARTALGGAAELAAIRTIVLKGRYRYPNGAFALGGQHTPEFLTEQLEIRILLPDHYLKLKGSTRSGIAGSQLLDGNLGATESGIGPPPTLLEAMKTWHRQDLGRLLLRIFLRTDSVYPLSVKSQAGNTLVFEEPDGTPVTIELDPVTSLPERVSYSKLAQATAKSVVGRRFAHVTMISDYRKVGRYYLPHRLTEFEEGRFHSELQLESIDMNVALTRQGFSR